MSRHQRGCKVLKEFVQGPLVGCAGALSRPYKYSWSAVSGRCEGLFRQLVAHPFPIVGATQKVQNASICKHLQQLHAFIFSHTLMTKKQINNPNLGNENNLRSAMPKLGLWTLNSLIRRPIGLSSQPTFSNLILVALHLFLVCYHNNPFFLNSSLTKS